MNFIILFQLFCYNVVDMHNAVLDIFSVIFVENIIFNRDEKIRSPNFCRLFVFIYIEWFKETYIILGSNRTAKLRLQNSENTRKACQNMQIGWQMSWKCLPVHWTSPPLHSDGASLTKPWWGHPSVTLNDIFSFSKESVVSI